MLDTHSRCSFRFRLTDGSSALDTAFTISFRSNATVSSSIGSSNAIAANGICVGPNTKGYILSSASATRYPCQVMDLSLRDLSAVVTGPATFSYELDSAPRLPLSGISSYTFTTASYRILGPADPAVYPLIVRIQPTYIEFAVDLSLSVVLQAGQGCLGSTTQTYYVRDDWGWNDANPAKQVILSCPGEAILLGSDSGKRIRIDAAVYASGVRTSETITTAGLSRQYDVPADSGISIAYTLPAGYKFTVDVHTSTTFFSAPSIIVDCASRTDLPYVNATMRSLTDLMQAGTLVIASGKFPTTFRLLFTPTAAPCVTGVPLPTHCGSLFASEQIWSQEYYWPYLNGTINTQVSQFAALFPNDVSTNSACYQAFLQETCYIQVPRCDATGLAKKIDTCFDLCKARLTSASCSRSWATQLCSSWGPCARPVALADAPAAPPRVAGDPPSADGDIPLPPSLPASPPFVASPVTPPASSPPSPTQEGS